MKPAAEPAARKIEARRSEACRSEAWQLVFTGLSLTCVTAAALFVLMSINPKDAVYGGMPLGYAAGAAVLAVAFNRAAARAARS